jgi:hypothetical protein
VLAYKPGGKRTMQIDECRIGTEPITIGRRGHSGDNGIFGDDARKYERESIGRWPANICHDGSEEVLQRLPYRACGDGTYHSRVRRADRNGNTGAAYGRESRPAGTPTPSYGDEGSAAQVSSTVPKPIRKIAGSQSIRP